MTREDIIRMAREAGFLTGTRDYADGNGGHPFVASVASGSCLPELERFAALVYAAGAAAEREACAAVCCDMIDAEYKTGKVDHNEMAWTQACANAIRARGKQE